LLWFLAQALVFCNEANPSIEQLLRTVADSTGVTSDEIKHGLTHIYQRSRN
jgi:hypothetical protein